MSATPTTATHPAFQAGDPVVVLYQGLYYGMPGRFVGPRNDPNWADIEERFGSLRAHPVAWLRRLADVQDLTASRGEGFRETRH